ncbi:MAG TPA: hypothetical protein VGD41_00705, partial [Pyrinomonadaceae bacterium]
WAVLIAAFIALQCFVGHPQTFVYSQLLVIAYAVVIGLAEREQRRRLVLVLSMIATGLLLAAVQILPTFEMLRNSVRSNVSYEFFTSFSMPGRYLTTYLAPYVMGGGDGRLFRAPYVGTPFYGEMVAYAGVLSVVLSGISLLFKRDRQTIFWAAVVLVAFVLALGDYAPLSFYRLVYHIPVLNLFRVPARHLMELEFGLVVLAGRGLTALTRVEIGSRERLRIGLICVAVVVITCLIVTVGRPGNFRLGREAPVTILRAPELFFPIVIACLSAASIFLYLKLRRQSAVLAIVGMLALDLLLWGQFTGWMLSPRRSDEMWAMPKSVAAINNVAPKDPSSYRILTAPHTFDPATAPVPPSVSHSTEWNLWTQPNLYMAHGIHNAAGYDGFGLGRYSRMAGEMKVWGELTNPDNALRGESRELDILNVRYLVSMRRQAATATGTVSEAYPVATQKYGQWTFGPTDLGLPLLKSEGRLVFKIPPVSADRLALVTNLSFSENVPDGMTVALMRLNTTDGHVIEFPLRAGNDTSEWAHDRADINARIKHKRAEVAASYPVDDANGKYNGHTYVTSISFNQSLSITGGEFVIEPVATAPDLTMQVFRVTLVDSNSDKSYAFKRAWFALEKSEKRPETKSSDRWSLLRETPDVQIYENLHYLPRAWLVTDTRVLTDGQLLATLRTGRLPDGSKWEPLRTVLTETETGFESVAGVAGKADIVLYEPNRVEVRTQSDVS